MADVGTQKCTKSSHYMSLRAEYVLGEEISKLLKGDDTGRDYMGHDYTGTCYAPLESPRPRRSF